MYILGMKEEKVNASQFEEIDEKVKQLGAKAKRLEEQLADQYRSNFGYLFQKVPSIDTSDAKVVVDCVAAWLEVAKLNPSQLRKHITSLETELAKKQAEAQKKSIKLEQKRRELTAKYNDYKSLMQEGKQIVAHMDIVSTKHFGPFLVSMHEKLSNELRQSLVHMKTEVSHRISIYLFNCARRLKFPIKFTNKNNLAFHSLFQLAKLDLNFDPAEQT